MRLGDLIDDLAGVRIVSGDASTRVCDLTDDSRTVLPGSMFVARRGPAADGRAFIADAIAAGACAVLTDAEGLRDRSQPGAPAAWILADDVALAAARTAERFFGAPSDHLFVAAVTGTNGKTTVAHAVHSILNSADLRCGLVGTVTIDDGREVAPAGLTTPGSIELSRTLATMLESGCRAAAVEASSHGLDQHRVSGVRVRTAVFTNLTRDHLDYHGTIERYADAKATLFRILEPDGTAVVNIDDPHAGRMLDVCAAAGTERRVLRCSLDRSDADARAEIIEQDADGMLLRLDGPWAEPAGGGPIRARAPFIGAFNAMNLLQAACVAWAAGLDRHAIESALTTVRPPAGRLEPIDTGGSGVRAWVDFAHTDDALDRALAGLRRVLPRDAGRLIVVFGCGGNKDRGKRPRMAEAACAHADVVIVTSDNPRTETPSSIIADVLAGVPAGTSVAVHVDADRGKAIRRAFTIAEPGDAVVIAGKGHEREQALPDGSGGVVVRPWDDAAEARRAAGERGQRAAREGISA